MRGHLTEAKNGFRFAFYCGMDYVLCHVAFCFHMQEPNDYGGSPLAESFLAWHCPTIGGHARNKNIL